LKSNSFGCSNNDATGAILFYLPARTEIQFCDEENCNGDDKAYIATKKSTTFDDAVITSFDRTVTNNAYYEMYYIPHNSLNGKVSRVNLHLN
jgi:hypothetical protein